MEDILGILDRINRELGITVVSVTHDINNAVLRSDRIAVIKKGAVVFCGGGEELMNNDVLAGVYGMSFTFVRHPSGGRLIIVPGGGKP